MRISYQDINQLRKTIDASSEILVVTHKHPTVDSLAAAISFYLALPQLGKRVTVVCPDPMKVKDSNLVAIDKVKDSLDGKNFIISLDYVEGSIEKVSYHIDKDKFNLVIEPRAGFSFSQDKVSFSEGGTNSDLLITVGVDDVANLANLRNQVESLVKRVEVINIDIKTNNSQYGKINLIYPQTASISEVVAQLLQGINLSIDTDNAANLLQGIKEATNNFSHPQTNPDLLEVAAFLMRRSGQQLEGRVTPSQTLAAQPQPVARFQSNQGQPAFRPLKQDFQPPADWLKPKIFSSKSANQPDNYSPSEAKGRIS